jgi:hypothetical protein
VVFGCDFAGVVDEGGRDRHGGTLSCWLSGWLRRRLG